MPLFDDPNFHDTLSMVQIQTSIVFPVCIVNNIIDLYHFPLENICDLEHFHLPTEGIFVMFIFSTFSRFHHSGYFPKFGLLGVFIKKLWKAGAEIPEGDCMQEEHQRKF